MAVKPWATIYALLLVACASKPAVPPKPQLLAAPVCTEGRPIPSKLTGIRPAQSATCPYDFQEVVTRIRQLGADKHVPYTVETAQHALGLPDMQELYENPRLAGYSMRLVGPGGWRLNVYVSESGKYFDQGPARFVPGVHPQRLFKPDDDYLKINFRVEGPQPGSFPNLDPNQCIRNGDVSDALIQTGWQDKTIWYPPPTDGARPNLDLVRDNRSAQFSGLKQDCFINLTLFQRPVSPKK